MMANIGLIDADPTEPPSNEDVVSLANCLLSEFNIPTKIEDVDDICAALFVLLYENLFSDRLDGVIRQPVSKEDEIHNCQTVIDVLSSDIVRDNLSHIRGVDIVDGDITAISNLLDIFSYLLEYVANRIESDIATDNDDAKSLTTGEQESELGRRENLKKSNRQHFSHHSREKRSYSSRPDRTVPKSRHEMVGMNGSRSPMLDTNDNRSAVLSQDIPLSRPTRVTSPGYVAGDHLGMDPDDFKMPPSPIRPDQSQSLLGQKTVDSTDLDLQYGNDDMGSPKGSSAPKIAWEDDSALNTRRDLDADILNASEDATVGGVVSSSAATSTVPPRTCSTAPTEAATTSNDLLAPESRTMPHMSASMPPPHSQRHELKESSLRSTVGSIEYHSPTIPHKSNSERSHDPTLVKGLSSSYNELRYLVERTAAMTRAALQTSPILGRAQRDLDITDMTDRPRPTIPSDGVRLAKELNAQGMRRGETPTSPSKNTKKVAFSSYTNDSCTRNRHPLEELSDNEYARKVIREASDDLGRAGGNGKEWMRDYHDGKEDYKSRTRSTSPERRKRTNKPVSKTEEFAKHLARSRQPELGAAHLKLKTEDRAIKKKQEFLQKMYQEDLGDFSEDVQSILNKDYEASQQKEKEMLKSYQQSNPIVKGVKKSKGTSKTVSCKKPKLGTKVVSSKSNGSSSVSKVSGSKPSPALKLESEEDLLPFLLEEFPHLHLSDHTWHELCRKGLHQIENITRVYQESKRKKSRAQLQLEEAAQRHELLSEIMKKELESTKRVRELKERKAQQVQVKNKTHEKRVQSARARGYYNEYQVRARSKQLKRRTREEMVFRDLFKDAMKIQKERIKDIRQYATDQRKSQETRRQNEMESLENFYQDQFQMLAEKLSRERMDNCLRDKAQQQMVERIRRELRKKIESEICLYQEQMFRDDDDAHFRQMDADRVKRQLHMARYAAQI